MTLGAIAIADIGKSLTRSNVTANLRPTQDDYQQDQNDRRENPDHTSADLFSRVASNRICVGVRSWDWNNRGYWMHFHPAVLPVNNICSRDRNSFPDQIGGKYSLAEAITYAFGNGIAL
jgi:hypothetical protein